MKTQWFICTMTVVIICCIFASSYGANKFYYGTYGGEKYAYTLKNDLNFNITTSWAYPDDLDRLAQNSLRGLITSIGINGPTGWADSSHYTLWEAEGLTGSLFGFTYHGGGTLVNSAGASGGKAMYFWTPHDTAGLIQTGPWYDQEYSQDRAVKKYTAGFRLRSPLDYPSAMGKGRPVPICSLMVVSIDSSGDTVILKSTTLTSTDFPEWVGYKTFTLADYQLPVYPHYYDYNRRRVDFRIYWFGNRALYIDYVKVYDYNGNQLMSGQRDSDIINYVSQSWVTEPIQGTGEPVVYRWYMRDEPWSIDHYAPYRHIDSLLKSVSIERMGFQAYTDFANSDNVHEYMLRENPKDYCIDPYPTWMFGNNYTGGFYQQKWSEYMNWLNRSKIVADSLDKDFWVTIQAHMVGISKHDYVANCYYSTYMWNNVEYCPLFREPTAEELRLQSFLSLCYGANGILHFNYPFVDNCPDTLYCPDSSMFTGLYDGSYGHDSLTYKWWEIKNFISPRVVKIGPILNQLTWQGACSNQEVGSFFLRNSRPSYIDSIIGRQHDSTYVQVGFFDYGRDDYFMLVNRKCLATEYESLQVYVDKSDGPWLAVDMFTNEPIGKVCGLAPLIVPLQPGEGRLFKLVKYLGDRVIRVYHSLPNPTIQSAIDDASDPWTTIIVYDSVYHENIDFKGKNVTVVSLYHIDGDTSHISHTIIDGSQPTDTTKASVVMFVSGENSNAILKGFTIRNGKGTKYISKDRDLRFGGGIYCKDSSPIIINNVIMADTVNGDGGGIYCQGSSPQILNNAIKQNKAICYGGGIAISISNGGPPNPVLSNNVITGNSAEQRGGGIYYWGNPVITNNIIDGNSANWNGGGIYLVWSATGQIENNTITNSTHGNGISGQEGPEVMSYNDVYDNDSLDFDIIYPIGVGNLNWGFNRRGDECDTFFNISQDPYSYYGYHCINAGDNNASGMLNFDFDGNPRIVDGFVDMGAYEYQGGSKSGNAKIASSDTNSNKLHLPAEAPK
jgi:parallel beta-helix repeat protein